MRGLGDWSFAHGHVSIKPFKTPPISMIYMTGKSKPVPNVNYYGLSAFLVGSMA